MPAELLRNVCLRKDPHSPYADQDGYVPFGKLVEYAGGRSNGCTSWSPSDAGQIIAMMKDDPTTLYIYPEAARHRRRRASGEGRPVAVARGAILERFLFERNRLSEILAKGNPRADPGPIQEGSSGTAATANANLQGAVKLVSGSLSLVRPIAPVWLNMRDGLEVNAGSAAARPASDCIRKATGLMEPAITVMCRT